MLRSRSNTSGYTTYFWKKPWKRAFFAGEPRRSIPGRAWDAASSSSTSTACPRSPRSTAKPASRPAVARRITRADQAVIAIGYLDGRRLSRAVIAGAHFVAERAEALNKINVFPVPDGDTGTNVASTLQKIAAGISRMRQRHVREMSRDARGRGGRRRPRQLRRDPGAVLLRVLRGAARCAAGLDRGLRRRGRQGRRVGVRGDRAARRGDDPDGHPRLGASRRGPGRARVRDFGVLLPESLERAKAPRSRTRPSR